MRDEIILTKKKFRKIAVEASTGAMREMVVLVKNTETCARILADLLGSIEFELFDKAKKETTIKQ